MRRLVREEPQAQPAKARSAPFFMRAMIGRCVSYSSIGWPSIQMWRRCSALSPGRERRHSSCVSGHRHWLAASTQWCCTVHTSQQGIEGRKITCRRQLPGRHYRTPSLRSERHQALQRADDSSIFIDYSLLLISFFDRCCRDDDKTQHRISRVLPQAAASLSALDPPLKAPSVSTMIIFYIDLYDIMPGISQIIIAGLGRACLLRHAATIFSRRP